jgi:quinol monooxygenase YgiN
MLTRSLFVRLEAKPGKERELAAFLMQGLDLANREETTPVWFATQLGPTTFAIVDAFRDEAGRQSHLNGEVAKALMAQAPTLLAAPPVIEPMDVLGAKLPR